MPDARWAATSISPERDRALGVPARLGDLRGAGVAVEHAASVLDLDVHRAGALEERLGGVEAPGPQVRAGLLVEGRGERDARAHLDRDLLGFARGVHRRVVLRLPGVGERLEEIEAHPIPVAPCLCLLLSSTVIASGALPPPTKTRASEIT